MPLSALKSKNVDALVGAITKHLPVAPAMFPPEDKTDKDERFRIAESIREKLTMELNQEVPYGIAVEVERIADGEDGQVDVDATIWVDREGRSRSSSARRGAAETRRALGAHGAEPACSVAGCTSPCG